ncbi:MAG: hypothetical protein SPL71_09780 [Oribacterium sp.]|nr:hypothetical protein [Oribacterium sp.]
MNDDFGEEYRKHLREQLKPIKQLEKIRLVSNNICYGPMPEPDEIVEQVLIIHADGRVSVSYHLFGTYDHDIDAEDIGRTVKKKSFKISRARAEYLLSSIRLFFEEAYTPQMVTDVGSWVLTFSDKDGNKVELSDSLYPDNMVLDHDDLSSRIRRYSLSGKE